MKKVGKKIIALIMVLSFGLMLLPLPIYAEGPYEGYLYNSRQKTQSSINGYLYYDSFSGNDLAIGEMKSPQDLFIAKDDTIYVADSGNNRIIHFDANKHVLGIYGAEAGEAQLSGPRGIYVLEDGTVYVADTGNNRIAVFNKDGSFVRQIEKPNTTLLGEGFHYYPIKLVVDKRGYMIVASEGFSQGLIQMTPAGEFAGFFGANHLPFSLTRFIVNILASKEQKESIARDRPPEFSNLFQDDNGFIYTTSLGISTNQVKRLSAVGVDTLNRSSKSDEKSSRFNQPQFRYGDLHMQRVKYISQYDAFLDISVNDQQLITALDQITGKIFQYNSEGELLFIFGGLGNQNGLFSTPVSIAESSDGLIYVADSTRNRIDRFYITPFAQLVHEANELYTQGHYEQSMAPWNEVIKLNSNYELAYLNIGKALYKQEKFQEATTYFKLAGSRSEYSKAFAEYRKLWLREHFGWIILIAIVILLGWNVGEKSMQRLVSRRKLSAVTEQGSELS